MHPKKSIIQTPNTPPTEQSDISAQILPVVPNLCKKINRKEASHECLTQLTRTNTTGCNHKACVCVICDFSIIGVEKYVGYQKKS